MSLSYRPEIDGFRALAVTTVVLFHAKIPGFENGFIGVDIFFVISGFLITSIIAREQAGEGFSYGRFVMRRVRRILPALVVVMLACIPFAWWLMLPDPLENFGQSLVATAFSANNILLWLTSGYWDLSSDFKPLLHTWSLGVEEQFYILYPMLLVLALRLPIRACYILMAAMAALSFWLMVRALQTDPAAAFYLLHYRAWQLLIGGIAGLLAMRSGVGDRPGLAGLGLALVMGALVPLPGMPMAVTLALATVGAAFYLLWARSGSAVTWVFTRRPVIFVGLVSYSFYLWHQPVFAFLRVGRLDHPTYLHFAAGILLAFALAVLSWRYVERPFRSARTTGNRTLWSFVGPGMIVPVALGLALYLGKGYSQRLNYPPDTGEAGLTVAYNERIRRILPRDFSGDAGNKPVVLIAGNRFARDFSNVVLEAGLGDRLTLLYRDDLGICSDNWTDKEREFVARLDMLVFASGGYLNDCLPSLIAATTPLELPVYMIGPKHFGNNLNPLVRYSPERRAETRLKIPAPVQAINTRQIEQLGDLYIDLISVLSPDGRTIRVADSRGVLLTTDRVHLSRAGAVYVAEELPDLFPELYDLAGLSPAGAHSED